MKRVVQKLLSWIIIGATMGIVTAGLLIFSVDRPYIQQKAVMTLVQSGMSNPDIREMIISQAMIYLKSSEGKQEMVAYLKTPEVAHVLAEQMETPEFRQHLLHFMQVPEVRQAFIQSLQEVPEFKILKALGEIVPNDESAVSSEKPSNPAVKTGEKSLSTTVARP